MPVVGIPVQMLNERLGEPRLETEELVGYLKRLGCDVDGYETVTRLRCAKCSTLMETGPDGLPPAACDGCGRPLRERDDAWNAAGEVDVVKIDLLPVRPDMLDPGGLARAVRTYTGRTEAERCDAAAPTLTVEVDPAVADRQGAFRPYIACAVVRNARLSESLIPVVMKLQENLHWAMGRDRKLASIGIYDAKTLSGDTFQYRPVAPEELSFVPLMCDPDDPDSNMTPARVLESHPKGKAYAHLLEGRSHFPLLQDGQGQVLSMPPIINSEATKVTEASTDLFIDVTGLSERLVNKTVTVTATSLLELMPGATVEQVNVVYRGADSRAVVTPRIEPDAMALDPGHAAKLIGAPLDRARIAALLTRMGHGVDDPGEGPLAVAVPAYRNDVMHEVDLIEDVAMALGYDELVPRLVPTMTVSKARPVEELSGFVRRALTGLGLLEMFSLPLTSPEASFDLLGLPRREDFVALSNPVSVEQSMVRTTLLPGVLAALAANIHRELPHRIFEVGDVTVLDERVETGAREKRHVAAAMVGVKVGLADAWTVVDAFLREIGLALVTRPEQSPVGELWIPGRSTEILIERDSGALLLGAMGEVHPAVLERLGIRAPAVALELDLSLLEWG